MNRAFLLERLKLWLFSKSEMLLKVVANYIVHVMIMEREIVVPAYTDETYV